MKVIDHIKNSNSSLVSFEIIPPLRGGKLEEHLKAVEDLKDYPSFIDVTSHSTDVEYKETSEGSYKINTRRKRPGTDILCSIIQNKYGIDAVGHVLCNGFTGEETEDFLINLDYGGIENVLAIRGDGNNYKQTPPGRTQNNYAVDLVGQIKNLNNGLYLGTEELSNPTNFCIGVAGYPEKHFESPNKETDIKYLKEKIDAGAEYIVTQICFDNEAYFRFVDSCRKSGINVPIIPGLKVLSNKKHLTSLPRQFHINIPYELSERVYNAEKEDVVKMGIEFATKQAEQLRSQKVPSTHFYLMSNSNPTKQVLENLNLPKRKRLG